MDKPKSEMNAVELILAIHRQDNAPSLNILPGLWKRVVDEHWTFWVNGHREARAIEDSLLGSQGARVNPYDCWVEFNGWPAGSFSLPTGEGVIAAGQAANYETFCEALRRVLP